MTYNNLYELRPKLERIYNKIEKLNDYGFNTNEFIKEIKMLDAKIDKIKEENNSLIGSVAYQAEDDKLIKDLSVLIDNFEKFIDKILISSKMLEDYKVISIELDEELNDEEFKSVIEKVLNSIIDLKELVKIGYKFNDNIKEIFKMYYKAIKKEYQRCGFSSIHNALINSRFNNELFDEISNDVKKYEDGEIQRNYKYISADKNSTDKEMNLVFLIALNEDNYKDRIILKHNKLTSDVQEVKDDLDISESNMRNCDKKINDYKTGIRDSRKNYLSSIISFVLSLSLLTGGIIGAVNLGRPKTKTFYKTDKVCYDTIDGSYTTRTFSEDIDNEKVLKVYSEVDSKGERTLKVYSINGESMNPEDYIDYEVSDEELISEYSSIKDNITNSKTTDEFSVVEIITNIDEESKIEETSTKALMVLYITLVSILWVVIENLLRNNSDYGVFAFIIDEVALDNIEDIKNIFETKNKIKEILETKLKYSKEAEEYKKEIDKYLKLDEELTKRYSLLFKQEEKKLKLK